MIAVLGGLGAALAFGVAITTYARATRLLSPPAVLAWVMLLGLALVVPLVLVFGLPVSFTGADLGWLAVVGGGNVIGLLIQFAALRQGQVGVVATIISTEGAIAAVISVAAGEPLSVGVGASLAVVALGVVLTTIVPGEVASLERPSTRRAALMATVSAALFGLSLFAAGQVSETVPVFWVLVPARLMGVVLVALPLILTRGLPLTREAAPLLVTAAIAEVVGFSSYAIGARETIAVSAVLVSQFAPVSLILAFILYRERLRRPQLVGIGLVLIGVAGVAVLRS